MADKSKEENDSEKKERDEAIKFALANYNRSASAPKYEKDLNINLFTQSYEEYREEERLETEPQTFYEKCCAASEKYIDLKLDSETEEKFKEAISFTGLRATVKGITAFSILAAISISLFSIILSLIIPTSIIPVLIKLFMILLGPIAGLILFTYPLTYATSLRIQTSGDLVIAVLYIVVYMKLNPSLEGAVRFAAKNTGGKLSKDLKRLLWRVESGEIQDLDEGLMDYVSTWKLYNREFIDSMQYIRASMFEVEDQKRSILLDKAVDNILRGTDEHMKQYARNLNMPIMVLHGLGILLPVMGMIIFPLLSIFMGDSIKNITTYLFFGYDILLPSVILFFLENILSKRPSTKTETDISNHPRSLPVDKMRLYGMVIPVWPVAVAVAAGVMLLGLFINISMAGIEPVNPLQELFASRLFQSMFVIWGLAAGIAVYGYFRSFEKIEIVQNIELIETQFETALFALGNRLAGGAPLEISLIKASEDTKDLEISGLLDICAKNMNRLSMTFKQALFDENYGALKFYPSKMIRTIMLAISESVKKGTRSASMTMIIISEYLKSLRTTQEKIEDLLSETVSNMKFQAYLLIPIISGVVVGVSQIIMTMLTVISEKMTMFNTGDLNMPTDTLFMFDLKAATPPEILQIIVGIYVIELLVIISRFINKINNGGDRVKEADLMWTTAIVGTAIYTLVLLMITVLFGSIIQDALAII